MIRAVVLPFGRGGIIGGTMLGLGRALGETIAVLYHHLASFDIKIRILESGTSSVSALIAERFGEATSAQLAALLTAGLVLFLMTLSSTPSPPSSSPAAAAAWRPRSEGKMTTVDSTAPDSAAPDSAAPDSAAHDRAAHGTLTEPQNGAGKTQLREGAALPPAIDRPRELNPRTVDDVASLIGAGVGSLGLVWLLFERILPMSGVFGFLVCWTAAFVGLYAAVTTVGNPGPVVGDRVASATMHIGAIVVGVALTSAVLFTFIKGWSALVHLNFYTEDMAGVRPTDPLNNGGVAHAIVGSLIEIGIAIAVTLPLGVGTAVFMTEVRGRVSDVVRTVVEAMTALPSIVAGLFIYTFLIITFGVHRSGLAAAMALSVMMLPIIARAADVVLRVVPGGLREAGLALGATHWQTVWRVVLPTARPGLATALILGIARGVGETSPVLLTSGASTYFNVNPLEGAMNSLPLYVYSAVRSGQNIAIERAYGAASVLLALVLLLFVAARRLARQRGGRS